MLTAIDIIENMKMSEIFMDSYHLIQYRPDGCLVAATEEFHKEKVSFATEKQLGVELSKILISGSNDTYLFKNSNSAYTLFKRVVGDTIIYVFIKTIINLDASANIQKELTTDFMTGLYNRKSVLLSIKDELRRAKDSLSFFSLLMIDIDYFKRINDTFGHDVGDIVIKKVSEVLLTSTRAMDTAGRYGGEEFIVVLPSSSLGNASNVAEKIRNIIENTKIEINESQFISITVSIGVSFANCFSEGTEEDIIKSADIALYAAKQNGRNRCEAAQV